MGNENSSWRRVTSIALLTFCVCPGVPGNTVLGRAQSAEEKVQTTEVTVVAVGDILLSRYIGRKIDQVQNPTVPFENMRMWLSEADVAFGNLESPISRGTVPLRRGVVFRCLTRYVPGLVDAGFDVLSTANNHALDQGEEGLEFTLEYLEAHNIVAVGTRKKGDQKTFGRLVERNGVLFAFLAYSYAAYNDGGTRRNPQVATWHDREMVSREIRQLKDKSDILLVSLHAGQEYRSRPERQTIEFAHAAIDAGADAIIGHHPHWIQPVEIYRGKPIFYSLGNFVFDQGATPETSQGLLVVFRIIDKRLVGARLVPVTIENYCCPSVADTETKSAILKKIGLDSDQLFFPDKEHVISPNSTTR
jgi:poly-gamma-glutamate synthesis protein (capsule biosynthesis protein)